MSSSIPLRALILEDSEFDARVMLQALRAGGYDVHWRRIESAEGMADALRSETWDIILADYNMPDFNAPQALRLLQNTGQDIPFIIVSGGIGEDVAVAAMKSGAHDYVMKGSPARLLPAVERELREAEVRRRRREAESLLRESELRYRSLWETSPDAVLVCNEAGIVGFANPAAESIFGFPSAELTEISIESLEPPGGGGLRRALDMAEDGEGRGSNRALVEGPARRKDGTVILVEVASSRLDLADRPWYVLFARDITEKRRNEDELRSRQEQMRAAREIQQRLFPRRAPNVEGYDVAGTSVPADATGGDYYDFLTMLDGHMGFVVADVSGHGLGPSLLMAETRALLRVVARNRVDPGEILFRANRVITEDVDGEHYVTVVFVRLDPATGELVHASAGHPAGLVVGADGKLKAELKRTGGPLGFGFGPPIRSAPPVRIEAGDILLLYTDGIIEAHRRDGGEEPSEEFGIARVLDVIRENRQGKADDIMRALCKAATEFVSPEPIEDDLTLLVVKALERDPPPPAGQRPATLEPRAVPAWQPV
jgi:PAS domain S-box-containing protein